MVMIFSLLNLVVTIIYLYRNKFKIKASYAIYLWSFYGAFLLVCVAF